VPAVLVIKGNVIDQPTLALAKQGIFSMKKHFLVFSILIHLLLALLLFLIAESEQPKPNKVTTKTIKSYLYKTPPKPVSVVPITAKEIPKTVKKLPNIIEASPPKNENVTVKKNVTLQKQSENHQQKQLPVVKQEKHTLSLNTKKKNTMNTPGKAGFSSFKQLENLRKSIKEKVMAEGVATHQQFRSPSIMHGVQMPVTRSNKPLTLEEVHEKNTLKMSDNISITKHDNGTCIIEREQFLGSPVEGSTSAFACGESKFDKSFREHMRKVQNKIMPKR